MKDIKGIVNRVMNPIAKKQGIIHGKIVLDWEKIIGQDYARFAKPIKVTFPTGRRNGGVLHLKVSPAHALIVQHSRDLVVEKINSFFGYRALCDVRLLQVPFSQGEGKNKIRPVVKAAKQTSKEAKTQTPQERLDQALKDLQGLVQLADSKR